MALEDAKTQVDTAFTSRTNRGLSFENAFGGATSFLRRRYTKDLSGVALAITGVPFDQAVTHRTGTRFGPRAIREASTLQPYDPPHGWPTNPLEDMDIVDYGDVGNARQCAIEYLVDDTIAAISFINRRHDENHLDVVASTDAFDGAHVCGDLDIVACAEAAPDSAPLWLNLAFLARRGNAGAAEKKYLERALGASFLPRDIYLISRMPSDPQASDILPIAVISLVLAFVATLYPSWRASRVNPAEALRYE